MLFASCTGALAQGSPDVPDGVTLAVVTKGICDDLLRNREQAEAFLKTRAIPVDAAGFRRIDPSAEKAYNMFVAGRMFAIVFRTNRSCGVYARTFRDIDSASGNFLKTYQERSPGTVCERQPAPVEQIGERLHCLTPARPDGTATYVIMSTAADPQQRGFAGLTSAFTVNYEDTKRNFQTSNP